MPAVLKALKALQDQVVLKVHRVILVLKEPMVLKVHKDLEHHRLLEHQYHPVHLEHHLVL